jgi:hypothetical protein
MKLTADDVRLRVPLDRERFEDLKGKPRKLRQAQMAQSVLVPQHPLPLAVGWWPDTPDRVVEDLDKAIVRWNKRMMRRTSINSTFRLVDFDYLGKKDLMVGCRDFEALDHKAQFGNRTVGGFETSGPESNAPTGKGEEVGACELFWDIYGKVLAGRIFVPDDMSRFDTRCVLAHELGHGLLLGHDPRYAWRLMWKDHTGVKGPKPKECRWVEEIWT